MVVEVQGELYFGAQAIHRLAILSEGDSWFDRINRLCFGRLQMAKASYPLLKGLRNLLLRVLGVERIDNLGRGEHRRF